MLQAGLPNITGSIKIYGGPVVGGVVGAFYSQEEYSSGGANYTSTGLTSSRVFDASKSNSIYGNSTTVQPPAVSTIYLIKY